MPQSQFYKYQAKSRNSFYPVVVSSIFKCLSAKYPKFQNRMRSTEQKVSRDCVIGQNLFDQHLSTGAPEKLCTRRRDICEFDVERYLLNFANLLRMSVAWKLFQEHYHYFLRAEVRRRKAPTKARCRVSLSILLWGFEVSHFQDIHISFLKWWGQRPGQRWKAELINTKSGPVCFCEFASQLWSLF